MSYSKFFGCVTLGFLSAISPENLMAQDAHVPGQCITASWRDYNKDYYYFEGDNSCESKVSVVLYSGSSRVGSMIVPGRDAREMAVKKNPGVTHYCVMYPDGQKRRSTDGSICK